MNSSAPLFRTSASVALVLSLLLSACSGNAPSAVVPPTTMCSSSGQFAIQVFADAFHQQPQCQFDPKSNTAAYVYVPNVAPSDRYVIYVETTGANPRCVYMSPASTSGLTCNPQGAHVNGVQAPGGNLSLTWELTSSLQDGPYTIAIFDQTVGALLATVQVTLKSGGS